MFTNATDGTGFEVYNVAKYSALDVVRYHRGIGNQSRVAVAKANLEELNEQRKSEADERRKQLAREKEEMEAEEDEEEDKDVVDKERGAEVSLQESGAEPADGGSEEVVYVESDEKEEKTRAKRQRKGGQSKVNGRSAKRARIDPEVPPPSPVRPRKNVLASIQDGGFTLSEHTYKSIPIQLMIVHPRMGGIDSQLFLDLLQTDAPDSDDDLPSFKLQTKRYGTFNIDYRTTLNRPPLPCLRSHPFPKESARAILTAPYNIHYSGQYFTKRDLSTAYSSNIADEYSNFLELVQRLVLDAENVARSRKSLPPWDSLPTHTDLQRQYRMIPVSELSAQMARELEALVNENDSL